jgi:hypothetical protein
MKGNTMIKMKRGTQWNKSQIRVWLGPRLFFTLVELYSKLHTFATSKLPNYQ